MRKKVSEDCNNQLTMRPKPNVKYDADLDCQNYKTRAYIPNPTAHTIYLDILYTSSVDIAKFVKGVGFPQEVARMPDGATVCRLIMGENVKYSAIFFDVNKAREEPSKIDAAQDAELAKPDSNATLAQAAGSMFGGKVAEDIRMTPYAYNTLISKMIEITGQLSPVKGQMADPFDERVMPDLSCPGLKFGGRHIRRNKNRRSINIRKTRKTRNKKYNKNTRKIRK